MSFGQPSVRLELDRSWGVLRLQVVGDGLDCTVELRAFKRDVQPGQPNSVGVAFRPSELDRLIEALQRTRAVLLGAPDPKAETRRAQEAAGMRPSVRRPK